MNSKMLLGISIWFVTETWQNAEAEGVKIMESNLVRAGFSRADGQSSVLLGFGCSVSACINLFMDPARQCMLPEVFWGGDVREWK